MAKGHVGVQVVLIGTTETGVGDLDEDLVGLDLTGGGGLDNLAGLGALVDREGRHFVR